MGIPVQLPLRVHAQLGHFVLFKSVDPAPGGFGAAFLVLYKAPGMLDTRIGLILLYALTVLPIVIWIMRDQSVPFRRTGGSRVG